jgi:hypothetical protein
MCEFFWRGYGWIKCELGVLKLAAKSQEVALGKGACNTSTCILTSRWPKGGSTTPTTRMIVATGGTPRSSGGAILRINRSQKTLCGGLE